MAPLSLWKYTIVLFSNPRCFNVASTDPMFSSSASTTAACIRRSRSIDRGQPFEVTLGRHHRVMRSAEGQIQEERRARLLPAEERIRLTRQQFGLVVGLLPDLLLVPPQIVENRLPAERVISVRVVVDPARVEAEKLVESLRARAAFRRAAQMPFADRGRSITELAQLRRECPLTAFSPGTSNVGLENRISGMPGMLRVLACQHGSARWRTNGRVGVQIGEADTFGRQPVKVRVSDILRAETTQVSDPEIIRQDDD